MAFVAEPKDPGAAKWYRFVWSDWLGQATILTSTWTPDPDATVTVVDDDKTDKVALVKLSGGTPGTRNNVVNRITTSDGETEEHTLIVPVENR